MTACQERFGFARETWERSSRRRGDVVARPKAVPIEQLLVVKAGGGRALEHQAAAAGRGA